MRDEADALEGWANYDEEFDEQERDHNYKEHGLALTDAELDSRNSRTSSFKAIQVRYQQVYGVNKAAKVGEAITCICGKKMTKRSYQQCFCSNRGKGNCKDRYWNTIKDRYWRVGL